MITNDQILALLRKVNPNLSADSIDPTDKLDIDSLDRFSLLVELQEMTGIEVPDDDVGELDSIDTIREYLSKRGA